MNIYGMIGIAYAVGFVYFAFCFWYFLHEPRPVKMKLVRETKCKLSNKKTKKNKRHSRRDTNVETF